MTTRSKRKPITINRRGCSPIILGGWMSETPWDHLARFIVDIWVDHHRKNISHDPVAIYDHVMNAARENVACELRGERIRYDTPSLPRYMDLSFVISKRDWTDPTTGDEFLAVVRDRLRENLGDLAGRPDPETSI